ncbi:MAG: hypothetical protein ACREH9_04035 [Pseudomonadota bacterium]
MSVESDLGCLIMMLNPYTNGKQMNFQPPATASGANAAEIVEIGTSTTDMSQFQLELQANYADTWVFKGQQQSVNLAVRIQYRWPKLDSKGKFLCWVTDYMLVGFEGSGGGE